MSNSKIVWGVGIAAVLLVVLFSGLLLVAVFLLSDEEPAFSFGSNKIAVIPLEGVIFDSKPVVDDLRKFADDSGVKAIVLRIDSPGGGVAASQEIYREVKRVREEKKKPVLVSMGSVGASGGYYVACGADKIVANPGTITGSIGVIAEWYNYGELLKLAKLKSETFKSGKFKDTGNPGRDLTPEEREYFQHLIDQLYGQFLSTVVEARTGKKDLNAEKLKALADGRVFSGQEAKDNGLIDEIGNLRDTVLLAAKMVGISGEPQLVTPPKPKRGSIFDLLTGIDLGGVLQGHFDSRTGIQFEYLWK